MKDIFLYGMQFSFTLWAGSVQLSYFLIKTIRHQDANNSKNQRSRHCTRLSIKPSLQANQIQGKQAQSKRQQKQHTVDSL